MFETARLRRWVGAASALLALNAAVLQGGWACERATATPPAHAHAHHERSSDDGSAPAEQSSNHHDGVRCPLMAACSTAALPDIAPSVPALDAEGFVTVVRDGSHAIVRNVAPEPPPPRD